MHYYNKSTPSKNLESYISDSFSNEVIYEWAYVPDIGILLKNPL
jgi:hypothetical protein